METGGGFIASRDAEGGRKTLLSIIRSVEVLRRAWLTPKGPKHLGIPPFHALVYFGSAHKDRLFVSLVKYEPTGHKITYSKALEAFFTPRDCCNGHVNTQQ
ncbi:hypothetical protein EYF80_040080 [Liparis tanakae]|uniref:Uncharacterized protein n=1 Tax=Liparis tanakae TaxID=230148 RepID=A0A4Z2G8W0_9TELE|nr:hypothetical protein EYF80_040080 [Liparis tanakae]